MELAALSPRPPGSSPPPPQAVDVTRRPVPKASEDRLHERPAEASSDHLPRASNSPTIMRPSPPPHTAIAPLTPTTLRPFKNLVSLLLPIRYPDRFYAALLDNPDAASIALTAVLDDPPPALTSLKLPRRTTADAASEPHDIGGIACRLEPVALEQSTLASASTAAANAATGAEEETCDLYVQTLAVRSAFRARGLGSALLARAVRAALQPGPGGRRRRVLSVYAHVWEDNEEALAWYRARRFAVEDGRVDGYYRRLRPSGARVVRRSAVGLAVGEEVWGRDEL